MPLRVEARVEGIDETLLEILAFLHAAVDPDTGHHVCHHHSLGLALIEAGGRRIPALVLGGCAYLVVGSDSVEAVASESGGSTAGLELLEGPRARAGGLVVDSYWLVQALRAAAEMGLEASIREVEVDSARWAAVILKSKNLEAALLVPPDCGEERLQKRSQSFYQ